MQFKILYAMAIALFGANMAAGIATNSYAACNCPNNCDYKEGHSCKYKAGVSCDGDTVSGHCHFVGQQLTCQT